MKLFINNIKFLFTFLSLLFFFSCEKDEFDLSSATLPSKTIDGNNTFGFLLNNSIWIPYNYESNENSPLKIQYQPPGFFLLSVNLKSKNINRDESMVIHFIANSTDSIDIKLFLFSNHKNKDGCAGYIYDNSFDSRIQLSKLDFTNRIISGEFDMNLKNNCSEYKNIVLSDGRFDLKF